MVQHLHGGAASSVRRSNAEAAARVCAVVVKESRVQGRSWGRFKGGAGGLGVWVIEGACKIPGEMRARASREGRVA